MRAVVRLRLVFALAGLSAALADPVFAQRESTPNGADNRLEAVAVDALVSKANETADEADQIMVQGRRGNALGRYRLEMVKARDEIVEVFNRVNSNDDTDVTCKNEQPTGSRMSHSVCRSKAENRAESDAARGFLTALVRGSSISAGGKASPGTTGAANSQMVGGAGEVAARAALEAEMKKMMAQNRELYRAVLNYVDASDNYNKARGAGDVVLDGHNPLAEAAAVQP